MFTMASAGRIVTDWVNDPGPVKEFEIRFTRPVVVPDDDDGATVEFTAVVGALDPDARTARIDITAKFNGQTVLGKARATVALPCQLAPTARPPSRADHLAARRIRPFGTE